MKSQRIDIAGIRREQIVEAAVAVITEQGLQNLSLSEIEKKAGMSRGQLTYYFPTKEAILLAVFDRLVLLIHQRLGHPAGQSCEEIRAWDWIEHLFTKLIAEPPVSPEFGCLQYTFLSQIAHREDFRRRLAILYEQWRSGMALGLADDMDRKRPRRSVSPRAFATLVQAILHGLQVQRAADPEAFDPEEMLELSLDVLGTYLWDKSRARGKRKPALHKTSHSARPNSTKGNGPPASKVRPPLSNRLTGRKRRLAPSPTQEVNGERSHG
jgi:AcrR family transcriptional regulator